jgi:hypothetical protein
VEQVALGLPFVVGATVVTEAGDGGEVALLVFTGAEPLLAARELLPRREAALRARISHRLGEEFVPTAIELYAMYPRRSGDSPDHEWCARQYQAGALREREEEPLFRLLDRLRAACTLVPARPSAGTQGGS